MSIQPLITSKSKSKASQPLPNELLVMYRQRSGLTQLELAGLLALKGERMIQLWEGGYYLPKAARLKKLVEIYLGLEVFVAGQEQVEARHLWKAVKELADANSINYGTYPIFDEGWFEDLLQRASKSRSSHNKAPAAGIGEDPVTPYLQKEPVSVSSLNSRSGNFNQDVVSTDHPPHNLPAPANLFIGRDLQLEMICNLLQEEGFRLITLTGPGGIGKTRLALEVAHQVVNLGRFEHGVWLVELAPHSNPHLLPEIFAKALGLREEPGKPIRRVLVDYLRSKTLLLVLDNCEHLAEECSRFVAELMSACPKLRVLATSREALGLASESLFLVEPLQVELPRSEKGRKENSYSSSPFDGALLQPEAVRLFLARARAASVAFDPPKHKEATSSIVKICTLLEGIPLAIELAAAQVKILSVSQILERINGAFAENLSILGAGNRNFPVRHQTLKACLDWSYNLLKEDERRLFRRLSVFSDSLSLGGARAVAKGVESEELLLNTLTWLVDKSLLVVVPGQQIEQPASNRGQGSAIFNSYRYRMLEMVRQYAFARLEESGELETTRENHLDFYLKLAEEIEVKIASNERGRLATLEKELPNIRAALTWALGRLPGEISLAIQIQKEETALRSGVEEVPVPEKEKELVQKALRLVSALNQFWEDREIVTEGQDWLARGIKYSVKEEEVSEQTRKVLAKAFKVMGRLASLHGEPEKGLHFLNESLRLYRQLQDKKEVASLLQKLGTAAWMHGDDRRALELSGEAVILYREFGDRLGLATTLNVLGSSSTYQGDIEKATFYLNEALELNLGLDHQANLAITIFELGILYWTQGAFELARKHLEESLILRKRLGNNLGAGGSLLFLAMLEWTLGECRQAISLLQEGTVLMENWQMFFSAGLYPLYFGLAWLDLGDYTQAEQYLSQSLDLSRKTDDWHTLPAALEAMGFLFARTGKPEEAVHLLGTAEAFREKGAYPVFPVLKERYEQERAFLLNELGPEKFNRGIEVGRKSCQLPGTGGFL